MTSIYSEKWKKFIGLLPKNLNDAELITRCIHRLQKHSNQHSECEVQKYVADLRVWLVEMEADSGFSDSDGESRTSGSLQGGTCDEVLEPLPKPSKKNKPLSCSMI